MAKSHAFKYTFGQIITGYVWISNQEANGQRQNA